VNGGESDWVAAVGVKPGPKRGRVSRRGRSVGRVRAVSGGYDLGDRWPGLAGKVIGGFRFWVNRLSEGGVHQRSALIEIV
jgi:hypothetical protein